MKRLVNAVIGDRCGSAAPEFAMIAPILLLMLLGIEEFGRLLWTQTTLHYAVEEAARCAALGAANCTSTSAVQNFAVARAVGLNLAPAVFTVSTPPCGTQVSASFAFTFVVSEFSPYNVTLGAQSCFPT